MKRLITLLFTIATLTSFSQVSKFKKKLADTTYTFHGSVKIHNNPIYFTATCGVKSWQSVKEKYKYSDMQTFEFVAKVISLRVLVNNRVPLPVQHFDYVEGYFMSAYKLTTGDKYVDFNPFEF